MVLPVIGQSGLLPAVNGIAAAAMMESQACCGRCGYGGCDVRVSDCGCTLHARCTPLPLESALAVCPICSRPGPAFVLLPMSFVEIDEARKAAAALSTSGKRGKKRKSATIARLNPEVSATASLDDQSGGSEASDLRTGRWTTEETAYCDKLIARFQEGELPIVEGIKLNDFLANMFKSKQSRLTKKMKNAKLSSKSFKRKAGHIVDAADAREFSELEDSFFHSIQCSMERAEIRFHMQKEWREQFSSFCVQVGCPLKADTWLSSVEEMDRRASRAKDAARMARRKFMMGYALSRDSMNPDQGVIIDRLADARNSSESLSGHAIGEKGDNSALTGGFKQGKRAALTRKPSRPQSSPFLGKVIAYMQRQSIPFEHVDAWVPSFVPGNNNVSNSTSDPKCRLCYAGSASSDLQVSPDGRGSVPMTSEDQFNVLAFGEYSQKFSFDVGCGLPGRVYQSGVPTWEQNVENAPLNHFERCGGASQWGIKTVLGIPIPSPNVGRIVVVFYSRHDRRKDQDMVARLCDELAKLLPSPKWKLVVDIGNPATNDMEETTGVHPSPAGANMDSRVNEIVSLMQEHMPVNSKSPSAAYLPGFTSLRLMLLKPTKTHHKSELHKALLDSYSSYSSTGRSKSDIALMLARDYMVMSQQSLLQQRHQQLPQSNVATIAGGGNDMHQGSLYPLGTMAGPESGIQQIAGGQRTLPRVPFQALASSAQPPSSAGQVSQCGGRLSA